MTLGPIRFGDSCCCPEGKCPGNPCGGLPDTLFITLAIPPACQAIDPTVAAIDGYSMTSLWNSFAGDWELALGANGPVATSPTYGSCVSHYYNQLSCPSLSIAILHVQWSNVGGVVADYYFQGATFSSPVPVATTPCGPTVVATYTGIRMYSSGGVLLCTGLSGTLSR